MRSHLALGALAAFARKWRVQAWYIPLLATAMGLMMVRPLLMARVFDATGFATYSGGLLVSSTFCMLGCLGLQSVLQRKMPMDLVVGKELASLVLLVQAMIVAVVCAVLGSGLGLTQMSIAGLSSAGFAISVLHGLSQQLFVLATVESRSRGEPLRFSIQNLARATLVVTATGISAWYTRSAYVALLFEAVMSLLVAWRIVVGVVKYVPGQFGRLIVLAIRRIPRIQWSDALALMAVMLIGFALTNADRWLAATWLSPREFAWYAFAWILLTAAQSVQTIVNSSVYPSLARRYAAHGRSSSFRLSAKTSMLFLCIGAILAWPAYYVLKFIISAWYAEYNASLPLIPIFLAIAVIRLSDFWSSHLIIVGRERLLLLINVAVGTTVMVVWFGILPQRPAGDFMLQLSWLALTLTVSNCLLVICAAFRFRR